MAFLPLRSYSNYFLLYAQSPPGLEVLQPWASNTVSTTLLSSLYHETCEPRKHIHRATWAFVLVNAIQPPRLFLLHPIRRRLPTTPPLHHLPSMHAHWTFGPRRRSAPERTGVTTRAATSFAHPRGSLASTHLTPRPNTISTREAVS